MLNKTVQYACKKPKSLSGRLWYPSEQDVIAELDSAMNQWLDSLPAHCQCHAVING